MSKMGAEFEKNLDNAKYDLYKLAKIIVDEAPWKIDPEWQEMAREAIAKVETLDKKD